MITLRVPAVSANLGPGFDSFGLALSLYNYISFEKADQLAVTISGEGESYLYRNASNMVIKAAQMLYNEVGAGDVRLKVAMTNNIPPSRGLGSSSAAVVGGLKMANYALGEPLKMTRLLQLATKMEGHPDNAAAALCGGFVACAQDGDKITTCRITPPARLKAVVAIPEFRMPTEKSRQSLPEKVDFKSAVFNASHASLLALSIATGDLELFAASVKDSLHQPFRLPLIPGGEAACTAAKKAGALAAALSGSGSTIIAFTAKNNSEAIGNAMIEAFAAENTISKYHSLSVDLAGTTIIR